MTALASANLPVSCPICGETVRRQSRRQLYCSTKCRMRAARGPASPGHRTPELNAPAAILRYEPRQKSNDFNGAKTPKPGWSDGIIGPRRVVDREAIAGRDWHEVVSAHGVVSYVSQIAKRALAS